MIDGFKIDVTSDELIGHLRERSEYHGARARTYGEQSGKVTEFQIEDGGPSYSNNPAVSLAQSAESHRKKSAYFLFLAEHVVPNETYRLTDRDLDQLGIAQTR